MRHTKKHKGFTLIEMLIVIVIIGILAAALVPRIIFAQTRTRDAKRAVDMQQMANAIGIYNIDNNTFPKAKQTIAVSNFNRDCNAGGNILCNITSDKGITWLEDIYGKYMTSLPLDPKNVFVTATTIPHSGPRRTGNFVYSYVTSQSGHTYSLVTQLENAASADRCEIKDYIMYDNGGDEFRCYTNRSVGGQADPGPQEALYVISQKRK